MLSSANDEGKKIPEKLLAQGEAWVTHLLNGLLNNEIQNFQFSRGLGEALISSD